MAKAIQVLLSVVSLYIFLECKASEASIADMRSQYERIDDGQVDEFRQKAIHDLITRYGQPKIPIKSVLLYSSVMNPVKKGLKSNFQLTSVSSKQSGLFVIYLSANKQDYRFKGQLAHEIFHLLNPHICDAYMEGMSTVFASEFLTSEGLDWTGWESWFRKGGDPFYGQTYFMMKEIQKQVGNVRFRELLDFTVKTNRAGDFHLDIEEWLQHLPKPMANQVVVTINKNQAAIIRAMPHDGHYHFQIPTIE